MDYESAVGVCLLHILIFFQKKETAIFPPTGGKTLSPSLNVSCEELTSLDELFFYPISPRISISGGSIG